MQYKMVTGRVVATSPYPEGMNISFGPSVLGGRLREQLQILILKDQVSVRYELAGDGQELAIELSEKGDFSIRRTGPEPDFAMHYVQRAGEPVVLTVAEVDRRRVVTGDSFWNVYIAAPTLVRDELVPYLQLLRPAWQLATTGAAIEEALFRAAEAPGGARSSRLASACRRVGRHQLFAARASPTRVVPAGAGNLAVSRSARSRHAGRRTGRPRRRVDRLAGGGIRGHDRPHCRLAGRRSAYMALAHRSPATCQATGRGATTRTIDRRTNRIQPRGRRRHAACCKRISCANG